MTLANFYIQKTPDLPPWAMAVSVDGTWSATVEALDAKAGQRSEYLQVGEIRDEIITINPIINCRVMTATGIYVSRDPYGDGAVVSASSGDPSEFNETLPAASPFAWSIPSSSLFGAQWNVWIEAIADGLCVCTLSSSTPQLAPLTIPTRKLNTPRHVANLLTGANTVTMVPPNLVQRDLGDMTPDVKARDDVLIQSTSFAAVHARVKSVTALELELWTPHGLDIGPVAGSVLVSQASDGT